MKNKCDTACGSYQSKYAVTGYIHKQQMIITGKYKYR